MTIVYIIIATITGALISYFATKAILDSHHKAELKSLDAELKSLNADLASLREKNAEFKARLEAEKEGLKVAQEAMLEKFNAAAAAALGQNNEQFLTLARTQFEAQKKVSETDLDQRKTDIGNMLTPIKEAIEGYKKKVEELGTSSNITFGQVREMLSSLQTTSTGLQKQTGNLLNALKNPQSRGKWGEVGLRNLVEHSGMLEYCDFAEQVYREGEESTIKPDMVINLPDGKHVVVDSKVPLKAYMDAIDATDEKEIKGLLESHAGAVRDRINELSKKQYYTQFANTPDLVVLFMPVESALNAALSTDKDLLLHAMGKKIILATPATLLVVLRSFALIWQQHNMTENANDIMDTARELHSRFVKFTEYLGGIGSGIKSALNSYNDAIASYEGRLLVTGRKLEKLGAKSQKELKKIGPVEGTLREISSPGEEDKTDTEDRSEPDN